jgi:hypothetical protein
VYITIHWPRNYPPFLFLRRNVQIDDSKTIPQDHVSTAAAADSLDNQDTNTAGGNDHQAAAVLNELQVTEVDSSSSGDGNDETSLLNVDVGVVESNCQLSDIDFSSINVSVSADDADLQAPTAAVMNIDNHNDVTDESVDIASNNGAEGHDGVDPFDFDGDVVAAAEGRAAMDGMDSDDESEFSEAFDFSADPHDADMDTDAFDASAADDSLVVTSANATEDQEEEDEESSGQQVDISVGRAGPDTAKHSQHSPHDRHVGAVAGIDPFDSDAAEGAGRIQTESDMKDKAMVEDLFDFTALGLESAVSVAIADTDDGCDGTSAEASTVGKSEKV